MIYTRINLFNTYYQTKDFAKLIHNPNLDELKDIYIKYCKYKKFKSIQPLFEYEIQDNLIMGYEHEGKLVAFTMLRRLDKKNIESFQFAWDYEAPELKIGILSLKHEIAWAKENGYNYLYMGLDDRYKRNFDGYEQCPPA